MPDEASKAIARRLRDPRYRSRWFVGEGIDVGAGGDGLSHQRDLWPLITSVRDWDLPDGDAQYLHDCEDKSFDFLHSSHCLEHMRDPATAFDNWIRVVRPGGYLVVMIPDEDMYEQGIFPSSFNSDHKATFTVWKPFTWSGRSVNVFDLLQRPDLETMLIAVDDLDYDWTRPRQDQTSGNAACAIEFVCRKRPALEQQLGGRIWHGRPA